jgi:nucleoside-diphosphate kinase
MERGLGAKIISRLESADLKLVALRMLRMDRALAERHYAIHQDKPFFQDLVDYIISTPIVAAVFEGENAVARVRKEMGATDPAQAEEGTIRKDYGLDIQRNSTHASDSVENAEKEISLFFTKGEIYG